MSHDDFAFDPVPGLPEVLPERERMLWQGRPSWRAVARRVFKMRWIGVYFFLLAGWSIVSAYRVGELSELSVVGLTLPAAASLGIIAGLSWLVERTTVYTITSRRLVMRIGITLPMTVNVPYTRIACAALNEHADGTGDVSLALNADQRMSYAVMWPHARPWRMGRTEPTLRCVPNASAVAATLAAALQRELEPAVSLRVVPATFAQGSSDVVSHAA